MDKYLHGDHFEKIATEKTIELGVELRENFNISEESVQEIVDKTRSDITISLKAMANDYIEFIKNTKSDDLLHIVLRGHLHIEKEVNQMLCVKLKEPDYVFRNRFSFYHKLNLIVALGLLSKEHAEPFFRVNKLRNNFAHNLEFKAEEKHYTQLKRLVKGQMDDLFKILKIDNTDCETLDIKSKIQKIIGLLWIFIKFESILLPNKLKANEKLLQIGELTIESERLKKESKRLKKELERLKKD